MFSTKIDKDSIKEALKDFKHILNDGKEHAKRKYEFQSFKARNDSVTLAAIDGSNNSKKGQNFTFSTIRVGYELFKDGKKMESIIDPITVELLANNKDPNIGFQYKYERYYQQVVKDLPERYPDFEKTPERIRTLLEWDKLQYLIDHLSKDDIIIFDGSLISGTITTNHQFFHALEVKAKEKGIALIGLSKDTSLSIDSAPVTMVLQESSLEFHPNKNWYVEYTPGTYFVKFTKQKQLIFRLDIVLPEHLHIEDVLSRIAAYSFDPVTLGYPYPMQSIHDSVRISEMEREECFLAFRDEYRKAGLPERMLETVFDIYHDQLDVISWGR